MPVKKISCLSTVATKPIGFDPIDCLFDCDQITVRELISRAVSEQCLVLTQRSTKDLREAENSLARMFSSGPPGPKQAEDKGSRTVPLAKQRELDVDAEIAKALHGFSQGAFLIMVGRQRCKTLDELVAITPNDAIQFIRMTPLIGG